VKSAEKYSRVIISHPSMSQLLTKPYVRVYNPIDLSQYQCAGSGSEIPVIIHAPTNRDVKGTKHIVRVVEQLQSEGLKFKFVLIEGIDHEALRKQMLDADILVDSVLGSSAGLGMLSIEAMAMGLVVMTADTGDEDRTASGCPIIAVDLNSLAGQLCDAISNSDLRRALAREGKAYVAKFQSHTYVALEMLNVVNDPSSARIKHLPKYVELDDSYRRRIILEEKKARKGRLMRRLKLLLGK
jgi:glycosyltransferase involved in cell wall biosynthesis